MSMSKCFLFALVLLAGTFSANRAAAQDDQTAADVAQRLSKAHFEFSLALYKELLNTASTSGRHESAAGNLAYSPFSVNVVLSMIFLGTSSASSSSKQLRSVMKYDNISYVDVHSAFKKVADIFDDKYYEKKVRVANAAFVQNGVHISSPYARALKEFYHAGLEHMDFRNSDPAQTMGVINDWVHDVTDGQIPRLLASPPDKAAKMVLVNALSMDARWLFPFDPNDTFDKGLFFLPGNERLEVPMMSGRHSLPIGYSEALECRVLELPFAQRRMSLFILSPDDQTAGLEKLERNLNSKTIKLLFSTLKDETVNVRIPRFRIGTEADVTEALQRLGVRDIFHPQKSDLRLMAPNGDLWLSSIAHKSTLEIREQGARGAAASYASLDRIGGDGANRHRYFEVDHPFVFLVWDYYSGMLLLMGRVIRPDVITDSID